MVILRAASILGGQKEDKWMICSITPTQNGVNHSILKVEQGDALDESNPFGINQ
jgi:hypothetical protein